MSFFNDDDGVGTPSAIAEQHPPRRRPRPRRPQPLGGHPAAERQAVRRRRRIAAVVLVGLIVALALIVNAIVQSQESSALQQYNRNVNALARESEQQLSHRFFATLLGAGSKQSLAVEQQLDQLRGQTQRMASQAHEMQAPSQMTEAQRAVELALDLRAEAVAKISSLMRTVLGGHAKTASKTIAGDMEILLASDVIWSQRVKPLVAEGLAAAGVREQTTAGSRSLPNLGWLSPETTLTRISGAGAEAGPVAPGTHGHALTGVAVAGTPLQPEPALNHLSGSEAPTFAVSIQNTGENQETNVKVVVSVTAAGRTVTGSQTIPKTEPGQTLTVEVPVRGVSTGVQAKVEAKVERVPGETNLANNAASYLAVFE